MKTQKTKEHSVCIQHRFTYKYFTAALILRNWLTLVQKQISASGNSPFFSASTSYREETHEKPLFWLIEKEIQGRQMKNADGSRSCYTAHWHGAQPHLHPSARNWIKTVYLNSDTCLPRKVLVDNFRRDLSFEELRNITADNQFIPISRLYRFCYIFQV